MAEADCETRAWTPEARVEMPDGFRLRRAADLEHFLDQVDPASRRLVLVTRKHIGRASAGAEAIVHACFQDRVGFDDLRVAQLFCGERCLHALHLRTRASIALSVRMSSLGRQNLRRHNAGLSQIGALPIEERIVIVAQLHIEDRAENDVMRSNRLNLENSAEHV